MSRSPNAESLEAYAAGDKDRLRALTLKFIRRQGEQGATADEICGALDMVHNSIAPRVTELKAQGLIMELYDRAGNRVRRKTRQGSAAGVLVAAEFAPHNRTSATQTILFSGDELERTARWEDVG